MFMHTYGNKTDPAVLMLHPMGITAEKIYELIGSKFKGSYYLLLPDAGGHGEEIERDFISVDDEADKICTYLKENGIYELAMIYGESMGTGVALHMLSHNDIKVKSLYLDGAPIARLGFVMRRIFAPVLIWQKGIYEKNDRKKLAEYIERWGEDINEHMRQCFIKFTNETIRNISKVCTEGNMVDIPEELQKHTFMEWGADEDFAKLSPKTARRLYPSAHLNVRKGFNHCEYMVKENESYVRTIEKVIRSVI